MIFLSRKHDEITLSALEVSNIFAPRCALKTSGETKPKNPLGAKGVCRTHPASGGRGLGIRYRNTPWNNNELASLPMQINCVACPSRRARMFVTRRSHFVCWEVSVACVPTCVWWKHSYRSSSARRQVCNFTPSSFMGPSRTQGSTPRTS